MLQQFLKKCGITPPAEKKKKQQNWKATGVIALRDSSLKELPAAVTDVGASARVLDATNNKLTFIPSSISTLTNLQRLILTSNSLTTLPAAVFTLKALKVLNVDANQLTELPSDISQLDKLEKLVLASNRLSSIPDSIGSLKSLNTINISSNRLTDLSPFLGSCSQLEVIEATNNAISTIPAQFSQLQKLKILNLDSNGVSAVPSEVLHQCVSLQTLSLHSNPITPADLESTEGYATFDQRRRNKYTKAIASGALLDSGGMDEGFDRQRAR